MATALDHDALFKLLLTEFFHDFLELFAPDVGALINAQTLLFLDKESFAELIDPDRREADLVVQATMRDSRATLIVHLEHQAQADAQLDRRMFRYFARFYDRYDMPVIPIALCSYTRPRKAAHDRHALALATRNILDFRYQVVQLNRLDWRNYLHTPNPVAAALMARMQFGSAERWRVKAACLRLLAGLRLRSDQRRLIGQFVDLYLPLSRPEETAFRDAISAFTPPEQEVIMELVTSWEIKGRAEGRAEGLRMLILRQLTHLVGAVSPEQQARIAALQSDQLEALGAALLEFTQPEDLQLWLARNTGTAGFPSPEA